MKGLLVKDLRFTMQNKRLLLTFLFIEIIFLVLQRTESAPFVISYMAMGCGMLVMNTIATDEYNKSMAFLLSLPVGRKDYVREKYIFSLLCNLAGGLAAMLPYCLIEPEQMGEILGFTVPILSLMLMMQMVMLPIQLKYGGEKGRIVLLAAFALIVMFAAAARKLGGRFSGAGETVINWFMKMAAWLEGMDIRTLGTGMLAVCAACFWISLTVSKGIMEKKEF